MDTSTEYVEMCKKAHEIQHHDFERGDYFHIPKGTRYTGDYEGVTSEDMTDIFIPQEGRYYPFTSVDYNGDDTVMYIGSVFSEYPFVDEYRISDVIWLPRQDQLQAMLSDDFKHIIVVLWLKKFFELETVSRICSSMEQWWLTFVMYDKFNKTWNGNEWIKEGDKNGRYQNRKNQKRD